MHDKDMGGQKLSVSYSKKDPKYSGPRDDRPARRDGPPSSGDKVCYNCNKPGHFARECRERRRSRSNEYDN